MQIPLLDLKAQYHAIQNEIDGALRSVIEDSAFIGGTYLKKFEEEFAAYCGTKFALGIASGTDALRVALWACGIGSGDEVITVPNTFIATTEAITMVGAKARFVDVGPDDFNMDPAKLKNVLTSKTRAIIPVHLYGRPAAMDPILAFAKEHGLKVIGDAAQAHGAIYKEKKIGTLGEVVCFSFYPGKNLGAYGDGGAVVTDDASIAEKISKMRDHGRTKKYEHEFEGLNCRLDGLQAAILSVKLRHLDEWTKKRRTAASRYTEILSKIPSLKIPKDSPDARSVYHLYVILTQTRDKLQKHLESKGIQTGIHYPIPLHLQKAYAYLHLPQGSFPVAEQQAKETLSLPMYAELDEEKIHTITDRIRNFFS